MDIGITQIQVFTTLALILIAALVAMICDFLKGNNEQLRELAVELSARREERSRREQTLRPNSARVRNAALPEAASRSEIAPAAPRAEPKRMEGPARAAAAPVGARRDWGNLLSQSGRATTESAAIPAGLQDGFVLNRLVQSASR